MSNDQKDVLAAAINKTISIRDILDDLLVNIGDNCQPDDVFNEQQLNDWAEQNGYTKEEE